MRIISLDYGKAHTGVAISDPTGTIVRPLDEIDDAAGEQGLKSIAALVDKEEATAVIVGMPVSLSGERGSQATETEDFLNTLSEKLRIPVIAWDERFTSKLAAEKGKGSSTSSHSRAACVLLEDFLGSVEYQKLKLNPGLQY